MISPFKNDTFAIVWEAFKNLYPDKECECFWEPYIRDEEDGTPVYGLTDFADDGTITIFVTPTIAVADATEILAHELAHAAVGFEHEHDETWEKAFTDIHNEYNRIGEEMFPDAQAVEVTDGKAYQRSKTND